MVNRTHLMSTRMEPVAWLVLAAPRRPADAWRLAPETTVGRAPGQNDITVDDETASGRHLRIRHEEGQFVLYDLGSRNGTQVNGQRVERQVLMDEDIIVVGETPFIFKMVRGRKLNPAR